MSEHTNEGQALEDRVAFWRALHVITLTFYRIGGPDQAAEAALPEQSASDAMCVLHAMAHAWTQALGGDRWPDCELGDGADVLYQQGFIAEIVVQL